MLLPQVIATCSFDRTAAVWEEIVGEKEGGGLNHWVKRTSLVDSRTSVTDVKFGPKQLGLILATCSADGTIRIYECEDVMNMSQWSLRDEIPVRFPCSCISWNPSVSRLHSTMIAVASDETGAAGGAATQGKVKIYEYSENIRRWQQVDTFDTIKEPVHDIAFAPNIGENQIIFDVILTWLVIYFRPILSCPRNCQQRSENNNFETNHRWIQGLVRCSQQVS